MAKHRARLGHPCRRETKQERSVLVRGRPITQARHELEVRARAELGAWTLERPADEIPGGPRSRGSALGFPPRLLDGLSVARAGTELREQEPAAEVTLGAA